MWIYVDARYATFSFTCNKKEICCTKKVYKKDKYSNNEFEVEVLPADGNVYVVGLVNKKIAFKQLVPYIKDQKYRITYRFDSDKQLTFVDPKLSLTVEDEGIIAKHTITNENGVEENIYTCDKILHPKVAAKKWKYIKKNHLVSKFSWDDWINAYDCKCNACNYSWVSNPDTGYVRIYNEGDDISKADCKPFEYNSKKYIGVNFDEYNRISWLNKKQYDIISKNQNPERFPPFDELWEKEPDLDDPTPQGGKHYRDLSTEEIIDIELDNTEKVVTMGWHNAVPIKSIECPVCDDLYDIICQSGYEALSLFQRLRQNLDWKIQNLFFFLHKHFNKRKNNEDNE